MNNVYCAKNYDLSRFKVIYNCTNSIDLVRLVSISIFLKVFCYIERFFTVVAESENFMQLSFALISRILSSSSLHITYELEFSIQLKKGSATAPKKEEL